MTGFLNRGGRGVINSMRNCTCIRTTNHPHHRGPLSCAILSLAHSFPAMILRVILGPPVPSVSPILIPPRKHTVCSLSLSLSFSWRPPLPRVSTLDKHSHGHSLKGLIHSSTHARHTYKHTQLVVESLSGTSHMEGGESVCYVLLSLLLF